MSATDTIEQIIETGWHHFSSPRYQSATGPVLSCWCGDSLPYRQSKPSDIAHFVSEHSDCPPNVAFLMQQQGEAHA